MEPRAEAITISSGSSAEESQMTQLPAESSLMKVSVICDRRCSSSGEDIIRRHC